VGRGAQACGGGQGDQGAGAGPRETHLHPASIAPCPLCRKACVPTRFGKVLIAVAFCSISRTLRATISVMFRRRLFLFGMPALLALFGVCALLASPRPSAITRENEAKIHEGMTPAELQAILGGPPRDESSGPTDLDPDALASRIGRPAPPSVIRIYEWRSDEVLIRVHFDSDRRVNWIDSCPLRRSYPGAQETVQHWVHRMRF
jgi:hypothetical protein